MRLGTEVSTDYRWPYDHAHPDCWEAPHRGVLLANNDPRAWTGTIAFPRGVPSQKAVNAHLASLAERDIPLTGLPVLYDFNVCWEIAEKVKPYDVIYAEWEAAREAKRQTYSLTPALSV